MRNNIVLTTWAKSYPTRSKNPEKDIKYYHVGTSSLWVVCDKSEVFEDDPGRGTPAMVYRVDRSGEVLESATFWCALDNGLDGYELTNAQDQWLSSIQNKVNKFLYSDSSWGVCKYD
jgi:hypothetical protein